MEKKQNNKNKKRISPSVVAFIGAVITLIGGFFLSYNYIQSEKVLAYDYMASTFYDGNVVENLDVTVIEEEEEEPLTPTEFTGEIRDDYLGYLTIPK